MKLFLITNMVQNAIILGNEYFKEWHESKKCSLSNPKTRSRFEKLLDNAFYESFERLISKYKKPIL